MVRGHGIQGLLQNVVGHAGDHIGGHHGLHLRGFRVAALGHDMQRQVTIGDDSDELSVLLVLDHRYGADIADLHELCRS